MFEAAVEDDQHVCIAACPCVYPYTVIFTIKLTIATQGLWMSVKGKSYLQ